ncbi:MAG: AAA family ATPase, partial [Planctomycetota bacterium]
MNDLNASEPQGESLEGLSQTVSEVRTFFERVSQEIGKVFVGQDELVTTALVALVSGGHVLIEGVPGLGKTLFVKTLG